MRAGSDFFPGDMKQECCWGLSWAWTSQLEIPNPNIFLFPPTLTPLEVKIISAETRHSPIRAPWGWERNTQLWISAWKVQKFPEDGNTRGSKQSRSHLVEWIQTLTPICLTWVTVAEARRLNLKVRSPLRKLDFDIFQCKCSPSSLFSEAHSSGISQVAANSKKLTNTLRRHSLPHQFSIVHSAFPILITENPAASPPPWPTLWTPSMQTHPGW